MPADEQFIPADVHNLYLCMDGGLLVYRRLKKKGEKKETHLQSFIATNSPSISFEQEFSLWRSFLSFFFFFSIIYEHSFVCKIFLETTGIRGNNNKKKKNERSKTIYFFRPYILFIFHLLHLATILLFTGKTAINFRIERRNYTRSIAIFVFSWNKTPIMRRFVSRTDLENDIYTYIYMHPQCLLKGGRSRRERNGGCIDSIENLRIWVRYRTSFLHRFEMRVNASYRIHRGS